MDLNNPTKTLFSLSLQIDEIFQLYLYEQKMREGTRVLHEYFTQY